MAPPRVFGDRYTVRATLGAGGMGVVYRAWDRVQQAEVALKTMRQVDGVDAYRFKHEFRALADVSHPNVVALYHLYAGDEWFFTMELVEGVGFLEHVRPPRGVDPAAETGEQTVVEPALDPASRRRRRKQARASLARRPLDEARLRAALPQLVEGLAALHRAGIVHRDVKPSNVLVARDGRVAVCDFGLAVHTASPIATPEAHNRSGTPGYMSPEQVAGQPLGEASDWYGVGVLLYEALTATEPFPGTAAEVLAAKLERDPEPPGARVAGLPEDLCALAMDLLARDPAARPSVDQIRARLGAAGAEPAPGPAPAAPFVGRARQLAALDDALDASRRRGVAAVIAGPSGIGKSALGRRFVELARRRDALVLEARCYERETVPYKALDSVLDAVVAHLRRRPTDEVAARLPPDLDALVRLFPSLRRVPAIQPLPLDVSEGDPQRLRSRAARALRALLGALAADRATVIYLDDAQWGDRDSAAFFADLVHHPEAPPVLLVATCRSEDEGRAPVITALTATTVGAIADVRRIDLAPLGAGEGVELARELLGDLEDGAERAAAIAREAAGNPLFLSVLAGGVRTDDPRDTRSGLDDLLRARLARLPDDARAMLAAAATAGVPTPVELLARVAELRELPAALAALRAARLIRTRTDGDVELIEPYHDRIRELATAGLSADDAARFHRALARAYEASGRDDAPALVDHWLGAGDRARAAPYAQRAAAQAEHAAAFSRAAHYHGLALELGADGGNPTARRAIEVRRAEALACAGDQAGAAAAFRAAAEGAPPAASLELRRRAAEHLLRSGDLEGGLALTDEVLGEVGLRRPRSHRTAIAATVARRARLAIRGLGFRPAPPEELDPRELARVDVCGSAAAGLSFVDPIVGAYFQTRQLVFALGAGDLRRAAYALALEVGFRSTVGRPGRAKAERVAARARALAEQTGDPGTVGWTIGATSLVRFLGGDFPGSLPMILEAERLMADNPTPYRWQLDLVHIYRAAALYYLGRLRELTQVVPLQVREALDLGDRYLADALRGWRSNVAWLVLDDVAEARRQLAEARLERPGGFHLHGYYGQYSAVHCDLYQGDGAAAWQRLEAAWPKVERSTLGRIQIVRVERAYLRGRGALAASARVDEAKLAVVADDAAALDREKLPWSDALAALLRAGAAGRRGDDAGCVAQLERAAASAGASGMAAIAAAARWRLGERLGGTRGGALLRDAAAFFAAENVKRPERFVAMIAP